MLNFTPDLQFVVEREVRGLPPNLAEMYSIDTKKFLADQHILSSSKIVLRGLNFNFT